MSDEIASLVFFVFFCLTFILQLIMWYKRGRFLKRTRAQKTFSRIEEMETMLQIIIPIKLAGVYGKQFESLRKSAVAASNYWIVSLLLTIIIPIIISKFTK
jgi:uncharacterized membrane protein YbjE (DUF340 family)